ncbi:hypothetical protein HPP92_027098 [Vanilla planifolia]|uniref:Vacuolar iron transporter n=1 Tax=Vanilla planifolia TaxID=51239 RepID=A0A835PCX0_VANPL|nr:hypothetical protein HPP92_027098 [Vanilla planifolia]
MATETKLTIPSNAETTEPSADGTNFSNRAQWLRAAVLGANDGLVSTASLMMGIGAAKDDAKAMVISGFAGMVAGACSMAIGEFVSVYSQLDIEMAQLKEGTEAASGRVAESGASGDGVGRGVLSWSRGSSFSSRVY